MSNKEFRNNLLLSVVVYAAAILGVIFISSILSSPDEASKSNNASNAADSEYQDAMESKNYNPNSDIGGERCFGQICN